MPPRQAGNARLGSFITPAAFREASGFRLWARTALEPHWKGLTWVLSHRGTVRGLFPVLVITKYGHWLD